MRAVIYDKSVWIVIDEIKDASRDDLVIVNKGLNGREGFTKLIVGACDTSPTDWDCMKHCEEYNIKKG